MKYKIAYIDEDEAWINTFYQTFKDDFDIIRIKADSKTTLDGIVNLILEEELDGVITDYLLDESGDVEFNGNKIVEAINKYKPHFPVLMLTAHETQAIDQTENVNIIYDKDALDGENEKRLSIFKTKIKSNIERHQQLQELTQKRIEELSLKRNNDELVPEEEEELTKLFIRLDELQPEGKDIPANLVKPEAITKLNSLVDQTRAILDELKKSGNK